MDENPLDRVERRPFSRADQAAQGAELSRSLAHQTRSALPEAFVAFLDAQSDGELTGITWVEPDRLRFTAHYARDGKALEDRIFRYKAPAQQAKRAAR